MPTTAGWTDHTFTSELSGDVRGGVSLQLKAGCGGDACTVDAHFDDVSVVVN